MGLSSINESLPNISIEIIYANKQLEFKPPLEQIRQMYYHEMKKFIAMPNSFEGLGNANVYKKMGQNNVIIILLIIILVIIVIIFITIIRLRKSLKSIVRLKSCSIDYPHY
jgi:hypothetical protein